MFKNLRIALVVLMAVVFLSSSATAYAQVNKELTITINGEKVAVKSSAQTVEELIKEKEIDFEYGDYINFDLDKELSNKMNIIINHLIPVTIYVNEVPKHIFTSSRTVGDLLLELDGGIAYTIVSHDEADLVKENMEIVLSCETIKDVVKFEAISYDTIEIENDDLDEGERLLITKGESGEKNLIFREIYSGEELVDSMYVSETIILAPVHEVYEIGVAKKVQTSIGNLKYTQVISMTATAYTQFDAGCTNITATGELLRHGIVAVDPRVIPLGTRLFVEGYGIAIAADVGGAIKGHKIDLAYDTIANAMAFGRRPVTVYILEDQSFVLD